MITEPNSLPDLMKRVWNGRVFVSYGALGGVILALLLMLILKPQYEAHMIIAPAEESQPQDRSLAAPAPNSLSPAMPFSNSAPRDYIKFQQTYREVSVAKILSRYQGLLQDVNKDSLFRLSKGDVVTPAQLSDYIKRHVTIEPVGPTSSLLVTYRHPDRLFAENFLNHIQKTTDELIRNEARDVTAERIAYLQKALRDAFNPDHRKALTDQLMLEERRNMMISMDLPFAAEVIEPPAAEEKPIWPKAFIIAPLGLMIGAFFGFLAFLLKTADLK